MGRPLAGLLRGATLFHAGIFQKGKRGPVASSADFLRAVDWLVRSDVTVINASVTSQTENAVVLYAMSMLSHEQVILVAAAGNRGPKGPPAYPAAIDSAFAVTAVSLDGDAYEHANIGDYIDIAAPGIDLPTTSRRITSGTSLAVPFVTAAVARMVQMCGVSPAEAERAPAGQCPRSRRAGPRFELRLGPAAGAALRGAAAQRPLIRCRTHSSPQSCAATYALGGTPSAFLNMVVKAAGLS